VKIEFDATKNERNIRMRRIDFAQVQVFDFDTAFLAEDKRTNYGEQRIVAYGYIGARLHVLCFKPIAPMHIRVISLRKANKREEAVYEKKIKTSNE
jgi:uncharacterized protein